MNNKPDLTILLFVAPVLLVAGILLIGGLLASWFNPSQIMPSAWEDGRSTTLGAEATSAEVTLSESGMVQIPEEATLAFIKTGNATVTISVYGPGTVEVSVLEGESVTVWFK